MTTPSEQSQLVCLNNIYLRYVISFLAQYDVEKWRRVNQHSFTSSILTDFYKERGGQDFWPTL